MITTFSEAIAGRGHNTTERAETGAVVPKAAGDK
jgi:hypothetical protein